ncbi:MAG: lipopolysaccharide biosynthesis protein [Bacteroidales bacterium]|nr:lipopolysaccharide biosynthesis protein [Bacteroidales bacterium]
MSEQDTLKGKTIKGLSWSAIDNISSYGVSFVVGIVLARLLSPSEYGLIGIVTIFISVFNTIIDSGLSNALIRKAKVSTYDYNTVFYINLLFSFVLYVLLFFVAPSIASFFGQNDLINITRVIGIVLVINSMAIIHRVILIRKIDFRTQTKISLYSSIPSGIIGIILALNNYGVWSLVFQQIIRHCINTSLLWFYSKWIPSLLFSKNSFFDLFGYGWKLLVSSLLDTLWKEIYQVVIGKFYKVEILGQYTRAQAYASLFSSNLTNVVSRVSFPVLSSIQDDDIRLKFAYKRVIKSTMFISFSCMLGLAAVSKALVIVLIGDKWLPCVPFLQIMCFNMMLYPLHALNLNILQVKGRSDLFLKLEIIKKIISIVPILLGIFIGIYTMLVSSVVIGFICYYLNTVYSGPLLNYAIKEQIIDILPDFIIALIMFLLVYSLSFININSYIILPIQVIVGVFIVIVISEKVKLTEYLEMKNILINNISCIF